MMNGKIYTLFVLFFFVAAYSPAYGQTPTTDPASTPTDTVTPAPPTPTSTPTPTATPTPTVTSTPTPTPYTNPGGKQPPGKQKKAVPVQTGGPALVTKMQSVLARMDAIWAKAQAHMNTVAAGGKDVSGLQTAVAQVEIRRQAAVDAIASASASLGQLPAAKNPGQAKKQAIVQIGSIKNALRSYHQAIVNVIKNLKGNSGKTGLNQPLPTATVTPTVTLTLTPTVSPTAGQNATPTNTITPTVTPTI